MNKIKYLIFMLVSAFALTACGSDSDDDPVTTDDLAGAIEGEYEGTIKLTVDKIGTIKVPEPYEGVFKLERVDNGTVKVVCPNLKAMPEMNGNPATTCDGVKIDSKVTKNGDKYSVKAEKVDVKFSMNGKGHKCKGKTKGAVNGEKIDIDVTLTIYMGPKMGIQNIPYNFKGKKK